MTPKEKAKELISLFNTKQYFDENKNVIYTFDHFTIDDKKRSSIMFVDEIIQAIDWHEFETPNLQLYFWQSVKKEIEKL